MGRRYWAVVAANGDPVGVLFNAPWNARARIADYEAHPLFVNLPRPFRAECLEAVDVVAEGERERAAGEGPKP